MPDLTSQSLRTLTAAALTAAGIGIPGGGVVTNRRTPWPATDALYPQVSVYTDGHTDRPVGKTARSFDRQERLVGAGAVRGTGTGTAADEARAAALDALSDAVMRALYGSTSWPPVQVFEWREALCRKQQSAETDHRSGLVSMTFELVHRRTFLATAPTADLKTVRVRVDMAAPGGLLDPDGNPIPDGTVDAGVTITGLEV